MASEDEDGRLLAFYRRYLGEPERETDVYLGFGLFFGGIAFGLFGFAVYGGSLTATPGTPAFWSFRETAIVLAAVGLPAILAGVVVLLPVGRRANYAAAAGAALCLVAVAVFVAVYPEHWNVRGATDYSAQGIAIYAGGLAVLVAATGAALVAHQLELARPVAAGAETGASADADPSADGSAETVSDDQVRRDIDEAMANAELSWGGVEKRKTKRLRIDTAASVENVDSSGFERTAAKTARAGGVDDAVAGLKQLKGGTAESATGGGVDDQTAALRQLKERKRVEAEAEPDGIGGVVQGLKSRIGLQ